MEGAELADCFAVQDLGLPTSNELDQCVECFQKLTRRVSRIVATLGDKMSNVHHVPGTGVYIGEMNRNGVGRAAGFRVIVTCNEKVTETLNSFSSIRQVQVRESLFIVGVLPVQAALKPIPKKDASRFTEGVSVASATMSFHEYVSSIYVFIFDGLRKLIREPKVTVNERDGVGVVCFRHLHGVGNAQPICEQDTSGKPELIQVFSL